MKPHKRKGRAALRKRRELAKYKLIYDTDPGPVFIENAILSGEAIRFDGGYAVRRKNGN